MSWQATTWAKGTRGLRSVGDKLVLMILADYAHPETAEAFPSIRTLADDSGMTPRGVIKCLNSLEAQGFLGRVRKGNQYKPSVYRLMISSLAPTYEGELREGEHSSPSSESELHDEVKVNSDSSEGEPPFTLGTKRSIEEESTNVVDADWVKTLRQDPRWERPGRGDSDIIRIVIQTYGHLDLNVEALKCFEWLQGAKGLKRKNPRIVWLSWLGRANNGASDTLQERRRRGEVRSAKRVNVVKG